jgi:hypothetical protein
MGKVYAREGEGATYVVALALALAFLWVIPNTVASRDPVTALIVSSSQAFGFGLLLVKTVQFAAKKGHAWIRDAVREGIVGAATPLVFSGILYVKRGKVEIPGDVEEFKKFL